MRCRICSKKVKHQFSHLVLGKYDCQYFLCKSCGFLQTENPHWLEEAYCNAIGATDTGVLQRNICISERLSALLLYFYGRRGEYLDFAGGYGVLTRLMRDIGFDFYWSDKYCDNIFARGFESNDAQTFVAVTGFEVLEHSDDPMTLITDAMLLANCRTLIFSTELFEGDPPDPEEWWYYSFESGQHISFFQRRTLEFMARKIGLSYYSSGSLHMFSDKTLSPAMFRLLTHPRISSILSRLTRRFLESKTFDDHLRISASQKNNAQS